MQFIFERFDILHKCHTFLHLSPNFQIKQFIYFWIACIQITDVVLLLPAAIYVIQTDMNDCRGKIMIMLTQWWHLVVDLVRRAIFCENKNKSYRVIFMG